MKVQEVMTRDVLTVPPSASLKQVAALLVERRISGVPVVDSERRPLGVVSEADLLVKERGEGPHQGWLHALLAGGSGDEKLEARTASEAMTSPAVTIAPGAPVSEAAAVMLERGINRLPVVEDGALVGIVTRADLIRAFDRSDHEIAREIEEDVLLRTFGIPPETVALNVVQGEVTLAGEVETDSVRDLLLAFLARVPGVVGVRSKLTVREDSRVPRPERVRP